MLRLKLIHGSKSDPGLFPNKINITGINPEAVKWGDDHYDRLLCPGLQPSPPSQTPGGLGCTALLMM